MENTELNVIIKIKTIEDWNNFALNFASNPNVKATLQNDLVVSEIVKENPTGTQILQVSSLMGNLDCKDHTITIESMTMPLFDSIKNLANLNLHIKSFNFTTLDVSFLANTINGLVENVIISADETFTYTTEGLSSRLYIGTFAAYSAGANLKNCVNNVDFDITISNYYIYFGGLIAGNNSGSSISLNNCSSIFERV